ncbi:hypothetical protein DVH05_007403 [Phytophthora capsici]|nr:hypothetical protein DVH05_007403 [Phytophthora capsici]
MSNMTQSKHSKKQDKRQVAPAAIQDAKLPAGTEDLKDLETTATKLQTLVESLGDSIKKMERICEHNHAVTQFRIRENQRKQSASVKHRSEPAPKSESDSDEFIEWFLREEAAMSELETGNCRDHPPSKLEALVALEAPDPHYIELFRRLYGVSPQSVLESDN